MTRREQFVLAFLGVAILAGCIAIFRSPAADPAEASLVGDGPAAADSPPARNMLSAVSAPSAAAADMPVSTAPAQAIVSIQGAVIDPGVYQMTVNDRVNDLLQKAGGAATHADLSQINLAARLVDETTLTVPGTIEPSSDTSSRLLTNLTQSRQSVHIPDVYSLDAQPARPPRPLTLSGGRQSARADSPAPIDALINLNTASQGDLESLPGIGPSLARRIMEYREYAPFRAVEDVQNVSGIGPKRFAAIQNMIRVE